MGLRFPQPPDEKCSETEWQKWVLARAKQWGWATMHVYRSKMHDGTWRTTTTANGWPDLTLVRDGRLVFAELKDRRRKVDPDQDEWLDRLAECECEHDDDDDVPAHGVEVHVWRPADWRQVVLVLAPT